MVVLMNEPDPLHPRFGEVWVHEQGNWMVMVIGRTMVSGVHTVVSLHRDNESPPLVSGVTWARFTEKCVPHWQRLEEADAQDW